MTFDIVAGVTITVVALSLIIFLTIRNRRIIERIHSNRSRTIPQTKKEPGDERSWSASAVVVLEAFGLRVSKKAISWLVGQ